MGGDMGGDELDTMVELVLMIFFLIFLAMAMMRMVDMMSKNVKSYHTMDKIETVSDASAQNDPFYFTGYQAYMMGWVMDTNANVTLTWLGTTSQGGQIPTRSRTDGVNDNHTTMSTINPDGSMIPNFLQLRDQIMSGSGASVKNTLRSVVNSTSTDMAALYRGTFERGDMYGNYGPLKFHLELTDDYTDNYEEIYSHGGTVLVERRKVFQWVLVPSIQ